MHLRRSVLIAGLFLASLLLLAVTFTPLVNSNSQAQAAQEARRDPYAEPLLQPYGRYRDALLASDRDALLTLLGETETSGTYLEYRTLMALVQHPQTPESERVAFYRRALDLRIDDPLAHAETRTLWLEHARLAEALGLVQEAADGYIKALPMADATQGLKRLERDPYRRANAFLQARQYRNALEALDGLAAPSIKAPAYRALGEHQKGLDAYERWLALEPENQAALLGRAWSLFYLGENRRANEAFSALSDPSALYGRGLVALRAGDVDGAVNFYRASGVPRNLWFATDLLEERGRTRDAIPVYLELAALPSDHAPEAAYRALVLAERHGDLEAAEQAKALLPARSYLGLLRGTTLDLPREDALPHVELEVLELAKALAAVNDIEAAVGELLFALRKAEDEATTVAIAEALQVLGEFRQSQRAAVAWLREGSENLRTWKAAYPRAYPEIVALEALRFEVEPELVWAVMRQESAFYPKAVSVSNARGLMQVVPTTWDWLAELLKETPGDPFKPEDNIRYGTFYLRWLLNYLGGDLELVVSAYNGGQGYIRRLYHAPPVDGDKDQFYRFIDRSETRDYLQKVMLNYRIYQALYHEGDALAAAQTETR
jgi:soluble lytic murein transglycosylase